MHGCASPHRPDVVEVPIVSPSAGARIPPALRAFDLAMVVLALPLALVAGAVVAVAVWLDSPGPVIYRSRRIGRGGRPFTMLKFRTMARDAQGPPLSARGVWRSSPRALSGGPCASRAIVRNLSIVKGRPPRPIRRER